MKKPIYNPLAMSSKNYADNYGKNMKKYEKSQSRIEQSKLNLSDVSIEFCCWCNNKLCDSQKFNNTCFKCGKSPYSKQN